MKIMLAIVVIAVGLFVLIMTIGLTSLQNSMSNSANSTAASELGANYTSEFGYMPALLSFWWIIPIFIIAALICYALYKVIKS